MNDAEIRANLHQKLLQKHYSDAETLVINELGLRHGKHRADIAVINGRMIGYEIKSDEDNLSRLEGQIEAYNAVFDRISLVITEKHLGRAKDMAPPWWGLILVCKSRWDRVTFRTLRKMQKNPLTDNLTVAQLLWRQEVIEILSPSVPQEHLQKEKRADLYKRLLGMFRSKRLRLSVRECLKKRKNWRCI